MMKKLLLLVLTMTAFSFITNAQDSTAFVASEAENFPPPGPTFPKSYASVQTLAGSNLRMTGDWTIEAWVKIGFANIHTHIVETYGFGNTGGFALRLQGSKVNAYQIAGPTNNNNVIGTTVIPSGEWHHIAATLDETAQELKVYLDGELEATGTATIPTTNTNTGLYIGARGDDQQVSGIVEIDNVKIWSIARTQEDIQSDTLACFSGSETGLEAMYDFEDVTGPVLVDRTSNGNTGNFHDPNFTNRVYSCYTYVESIVVQGETGTSTIDTLEGTLQMEATVLPSIASDSSYTWSVADGTGSATISATGLLTAISNGTVIVTATANDSSSVSGSFTVTISNQDIGSVGINEILNQNLSIHPNPANNQITLVVEELIERVSIIDLSGSTRKVIISSRNNIDISELAKGIYFLQVQTEKGLITNKFIKK